MGSTRRPTALGGALALAGALLIWLTVPAGAAAQQQVSIVNVSYQPASLTVTTGDTVTWTNRETTAIPHTVTRCDATACSGASGGTGTDTGFGSTALLNPGNTYVFTLHGAGTYTYYCAVHGYSVMHGTITVNAATTTTTAATTTTTAAPTTTTTAPATTTTTAPTTTTTGPATTTTTPAATTTTAPGTTTTTPATTTTTAPATTTTSGGSTTTTTTTTTAVNTTLGSSQPSTTVTGAAGLAATGSRHMGRLAWLGGFLLLAGAGTIASGRRRRRTAGG